jgi:histidyl-tRNA synthetase
MTNIEPVKGFNDFASDEAKKRAEIKKILAGAFEKYGFEPAETPIIEQEEFVKGDNTNDEAISDIFKLNDKGKRNLALRYEFTFQLKRLMQNKKLPYKRYQIGEVFRDEPVSANRFRQITQCDIDIVGASIKDEAEILALTSEILNQIGIKFTIYFNNRKLLNEILTECKIKDKEQVIREIDKLDKLSEKEVYENLKKYNAEKLIEILKKPETYFKKYTAYSEIEELKKYCNYYNVKIKFSPSLARGLSYYNRTVFEVKSKEIKLSQDRSHPPKIGQMKETITAGGSYMFNGIQCTGISFGLDRLSSIAKVETNKENYLVVSLGEDKKAIELAQKMRKKGKSVIILYGKPSKALEYANSYGINYAIFVGEKEIKSNKFKVKNMKSGKESVLRI